MRTLDLIAYILLVVGGLNWGLVGLARFDLIAFIFGMSFGQVSPASAIIYVLVGLAGLYSAVAWNGIRRRWSEAYGARTMRAG